MFKLPMTVGPFAVNMQQVENKASQKIEDMDLFLGGKWASDPHQVISKIRIENGYSAYTNEIKPGIKKMANKGFAGNDNTSIETFSIYEKGNKRDREKNNDIEEQGT